MAGRPRLEGGTPAQQIQRAKQRKWKAQYQAKKRTEFRAIIDEFLGRPCIDCGVEYPRPAMHPDHVRGKKYQKISWFYYGNGSLKKLLEELDKCEVRCANCHCIRHAMENGTWQPR